MILVAAAVGLKRPKWITIGVLVARSFVTILLCYVSHMLFACEDTSKLSANELKAYHLMGKDYRSFFFVSYM